MFNLTLNLISDNSYVEILGCKDGLEANIKKNVHKKYLTRTTLP